MGPPGGGTTGDAEGLEGAGMSHIIGWEDLGGDGPSRFVFQGGEYGAGVCLFVSDFPPGQGPRLHQHPYEEVFVVHEGRARFTAGRETVEAGAGRVVVVPAGTPHRFVNAGEGRLLMTAVHPRSRVEMDTLEDSAQAVWRYHE